MEYTAPTGFRFLDEPMFCFSTLNANTNPNPNPNCRPGHRPWPLTPWQSLPGRRPWPLTPWQSLPGHRPWPLTRFITVSSQGRCPGRLCIYLYFTRVDSNRMSTMTFSNARDFFKMCMSVHNETVLQRISLCTDLITSRDTHIITYKLLI